VFRSNFSPGHNRANNNLENLQWAKRGHSGLSGAKHPRAKLGKRQITKAVRLRKAGKTHHAIAEELGVSRSTVSKLLSGASYRER